MRHCFKRFLLPCLALFFFGSAFLGSCTDVDNQLGLGLLPKDQEMQLAQATLDGINTYMALSDSIPINQLGLMLLGNYTTEGFGYIRAGALTQFVPNIFSSTESFHGFEPKLDSLEFTMYIADYFGDTTKNQKLYFYPVIKELPKSQDTILYGKYPVDEYVDMTKPLFSFDMKGAGTGYVVKKLVYEDGGKEFAQNLLDKYDAEAYNAADFDSTFRRDFPGFYIAPSPDVTEADPAGALYLLYPLSSYTSSYYLPDDNTFLTVYSHTVYQNDDEDIPEEGDDGYLEEEDEDGNKTGKLVKTNDYTTYSFDDTYSYFTPNTNIVVLERDYTGTPFQGNYLENYAEVENFVSGSEPSHDKIYIQGLFGVTGYLDFDGDFLSQLNKLRFVDGEERILNINRARLYMWLDDDSNEAMNLAPPRLGMYYDYKGYYSSYIPDYYYLVEQTNDIESGYGGYLNRAIGYYEMDITMYLRDLLSEEDTPRQIWLGPGHTTDVFYAPSQVVIQNPSWDGTGEPPAKRMRLKLTYTLLKKTIKE